MSYVKLIFMPGNSVGNNPGDFEMFIDFDSSAAPSSMVFEVPAGWSTKALKLYPATVNPSGKVIPDPQKKSDKGTLSNGSTAKYQNVFNPVILPAGFFFSPGTNTLISTGQTKGLFEFIVWITDGSNNDYIDPGIKNHD